MVTVIRVTPSEAAAALTATESWSSSSVAADSIIQQASETAPHSTNVTSNENGGERKRAVPLLAVAGDPLSRCNNNENRGEKKRIFSSEDIISGDKIKKRQKADRFVLDLSDVPPQEPIPKSRGWIKEGASKYVGVTFRKEINKWQAQIQIEGKKHFIGYYENEEEAAIDYARALFKYKGREALDNKKMGRQSDKADSFFIDLTDVPTQPPIPKSEGRMKEGASRYTGVYANKGNNKWYAKITIEGKSRHIGYYENEEEAAADFARAKFKYEGQGALDKARKQKVDRFVGVIDLSDVPPQLPIPKIKGHIKEGASKYTGASFNKAANKWEARIMIEGKKHCIGHYENEEEAAIDYARAVFKYKGEGMKKA